MISRGTEGQSTLFNVKEKRLLEKAALGETGECLALFSQIFDELASNPQSTFEDIKGRLLELMIVLHRQALEYGVEDKDAMEGRSYLKELLDLEDPILLKNWCKAQIEVITLGIKGARAKRCNRLISAAKSYIDANFNRDISLEEVSRTTVESAVFQPVFKEETGENFIDYLTGTHNRS